jgi:ABC-type antimicrobial peptide transport system permease subunit
MALGARPPSVIGLVLLRVMALVGIGVLVGTGGSLWASKFVASLL